MVREARRLEIVRKNMRPKLDHDRFVYGDGASGRVRTPGFKKQLLARKAFWNWFNTSWRCGEPVNYHALAKEFGIGKTTARSWFLALGGTDVRGAKVEKFCQWFKENKGNANVPVYEELADRFGFSLPTLRYIAQKLGGWQFDAIERKKILLQRRIKKYKELAEKKRDERALAPRIVSYESFVLGEGKNLQATFEKNFQEATERRRMFYNWFNTSYREGDKINYKELAKKFGVSDSTCRTWFLTLGGVFENDKSQRYKRFKEWFHSDERKRGDLTRKQIADRFGVSKRTVHRWMVKNDSPRNIFHDLFSKLCDKAQEVLATAPPQISLTALLIELGLDSKNHRRAKQICQELKRRGDPNVKKVVRRAQYKFCARAIASYADKFFNEHGRAPTIKECAEWLTIPVATVQSRVERYVASGEIKSNAIELDSPRGRTSIVLQEEDAIWRDITANRKDRPQIWRESVEFHGGLGFDFGGQYWDRYYELWLSKTGNERGENF